MSDETAVNISTGQTGSCGNDLSEPFEYDAAVTSDVTYVLSPLRLAPGGAAAAAGTITAGASAATELEVGFSVDLEVTAQCISGTAEGIEPLSDRIDVGAAGLNRFDAGPTGLGSSTAISQRVGLSSRFQGLSPLPKSQRKGGSGSGWGGGGVYGGVGVGGSGSGSELTRPTHGSARQSVTPGPLTGSLPFGARDISKPHADADSARSEREDALDSNQLSDSFPKTGLIAIAGDSKCLVNRAAAIVSANVDDDDGAQSTDDLPLIQQLEQARSALFLRQELLSIEQVCLRACIYEVF